MEKETWYNLQDLAVLFLHIDNFSFRNISVQGFYMSRCHCERSLKRKMHGTGDSVQTSFVRDVPVSFKGFWPATKNTHVFLNTPVGLVQTQNYCMHRCKIRIASSNDLATNYDLLGESLNDL